MIDTELIFVIAHRVRLRQDAIFIYYKNIINQICLKESIDTDDTQVLSESVSISYRSDDKSNQVIR